MNAFARSCLIGFTLLLFLSCEGFGQDTATLHHNLLGKWTMSKHLLKEGGVMHNKWTAALRVSYIFRGDGIWSSTFWQKGSDSTVTVGKWKLTGDGKAILLYRNRFLPPHDKDGTDADHPLTILKLTESEFITYEYLFAEGNAGTSYYTKVSH